MLKHRFSLTLVALLVIVSVVCQGTLVLAGTTGVLSGVVSDSDSNAPIAGATVTASSPSQKATTTTDGGGHYTFLNLAPDTYTVSIDAPGYQPKEVPGVTIAADNTRTLALATVKELKTIGRVTTRSAASLVKPGITSDVYSVDPVVQAKVAAAGGGGNLDSAWSALATVPGVSVLPGQNGYIGAGVTLSIRGGDYDQIGYEIDGVPVNRAFDNYPSGPTSSLGQQELQVYTGAPPANSESEGISGYINQVIKTGTSPGFANVNVGVGGPSYYHKLSVEFGGETDNRRFSYYVGLGGYNQNYRYDDQFNGAGLSNLYGLEYGYDATCAALGVTQAQVPSCYSPSGVEYGTVGATGAAGTPGTNGWPLGAAQLFDTEYNVDRDNVVNLHYYFPHADGSRDDLQALYEVNYLRSDEYSSTMDQGNASYLGPFEGTPFYIDGNQLNLPVGGFLPANYQSLTSPYYFPNTPSHTAFGSIAPAEQDGQTNDQAIVKVQYTKSLGSSAYARVYGYTYYSNWFQSGPQCTYADSNCGQSADYELSAHTRGVSFTLADQLNSENLLQLGGDYTTSSVLRDNNTEMENGLYPATDANLRTAIGVLVDSGHASNGLCYSLPAAGTVATQTPCFSSPTGLNGAASYATIGEAATGTIPGIPTGTTCGGDACQYLVIGNGQYATYNTVKPIFWGASLTDEFRPTPKLTINGGMRLDIYQYQGPDTSDGAVGTFWYNAYNTEMCENTTTKLLASKTGSLGLPSEFSACPAGYSAVNFANPSGVQTETYPVFQPRLGFTYTVDPNTVFRANYGRYAQPPNSAYEEYNTLQTEKPAILYGTYGFQQYGFTSPLHPVPPAASNNYDFSIEHEFPLGISVKVTPFLRKTQNQDEEFYLNRATNFVSGLNVGNQTSEGFEFELDKGDFSRQGLAAKLSFAYTHSYIKYNTLSNGSTVLTPVVDAINTYNSFTKAGGGSPCYTTAGAADPACAAGDVANPYYNAPAQSLSAYTSGSSYVPFDLIPAGIGLDDQQIGFPYVASLVLNEKINKLSITPIVQFFAGQRYGVPLATAGIDPTTCTGILPGSTTGDPRYQYGAAGGSPYDATTCGTLANGIPDVQTGAFDGIGQFVEPSQLLMHLQLSYDVTKNFSIVANLANIINTCFGGSNEPWNVKGACGYTYSNEGTEAAVGNTYNPGTALQPIGQYSYGPFWNQQPFNIFVTANLKI
jgi:hypothetical protein